ncbi:hypothetical protein [Ekhidna sp.]|uniref:hypothetical protein n=1 Tax=Ekhidna sp. TaxID=2608089 RepID=UPI0032993A01
MKKLLFSILIVFGFSLPAQHVMFSISDWSSPMAFDWSHPTIRGYGELSDSLSNIYPDRDFYEFNETYYSINTWADYYYWFTQKFWYRFKRPVAEYAAYYLIGDNQFMMEYIFNSYDYDKWEVKDPTFRRDGEKIVFNTLIIDNTLIERLDADRLKSVVYTPSDEDRAVNSSFGTSRSGNASLRGGNSVGGSSPSGTSNTGKSIGN